MTRSSIARSSYRHGSRTHVVPDDPVAFTIGAVIVLATLTAGVAIARTDRSVHAGIPDPHHDLLLEGAEGGPLVVDDDAALVDGGTTRR